MYFDVYRIINNNMLQFLYQFVRYNFIYEYMYEIYPKSFVMENKCAAFTVLHLFFIVCNYYVSVL